ncbi:MAG: AAA family ATPase [Pseudomonadales bacterium]|nr:AAA family ATPase [Pseudomonadales bacterium]
MPLDIPGYQITETLFKNDRTAVHRALRTSDNKRVILKQLIASFPQPGPLARFAFSYEVLSKFDHPNIVKNIAWLQKAPVPTVVLEDQQGVDLFSYLKTFPNGLLPLENFIDLAIQLAEALSVIHYQQVIHKDLHPGNILINPATGLVQVTDFGLASLLSREQPMLDIPERIEGALPYISPEQTGRMNRALDYRTDFYTLGVTFYQLLAGRLPFVADDALGLIHAHMAKQQEPLINIRPDLPTIVSAIIDKLLSKTAEDRYQSALGLKRDLEKVQRFLQSHRPVQAFPLGLEDISDRFQIPQKLYGRKQEVDLLMQRFLSAAGGKPQLLAVAGYSGVGKSALIHEVHKPIAEYNGLFCAGKFDQFQKNVPYSALQTALTVWLQYTLSLPAEKLEQERKKLLKKLGTNTRVLIDFVPAFSALLGNLPPVASLGADETQNRFHRVFQQFVQAMSWEHPLVLFIDDLQWADRGTLNLLLRLMQVEDCRLLLIVAYRDNEVDANHPAIQMLNAIENQSDDGELNHIALKPLAEQQVGELLRDALHHDLAEVAPLATLVYEKTAGNPFFMGEFLKTLYSEKLLDFNLKQHRWDWNLQQIRDKDITDNVVALMLEKMAQLPVETQNLIQLAACVGSQFDLELLANISQQPLFYVTRTLWPAMRDGLLIQQGGDWQLGVVQQDTNKLPIKSQDDYVLSQASPVSPQCRFLHDRMLQAAYESMSDEKREMTHLRVARLLLTNKNNNDDTACFTLVEQFNLARKRITDPAEKLTILQLNQHAAQLAKQASVWDAAARYASIAMEFLPADCWQVNAEATTQLYHLRAETEYLCGRPESADSFYDTLFTHSNDPLFKAQICATRVEQSIGRGDWLNGIAFGREGLRYLGLALPDQHTLQDALAKEQQFLAQHSQNGLIVVDSLPDMVDERLLLAMTIYPNLSIAAWLVGQQSTQDYCVLKGSNLVLSAGKSDLAAVQLGSYGMYLHRNDQFSLAFQQAEQAMQLVNQYPHCRGLANCYHLLGSQIWYLNAPYREALSLIEKATAVGFENGEIARAVISHFSKLVTLLSQGERLDVLIEQGEYGLGLIKKMSIFLPNIEVIYELAKSLASGERLTGFSLELKNESRSKGSSHYLLFIYHKMLFYFWHGDEENALKYALQTHSMRTLTTFQTFTKDQLFLLGLLLLRQQAAKENHQILAYCEKQLGELFNVCETNFAHKYYLFLAEKKRYAGDSPQAIYKLYHDAIESAKNNGFRQYAGLACELLAEFWLEQGLEGFAESFLVKALGFYRDWRCETRVKCLLEKYADLLQQPTSTDTANLQQSITLTTPNSQLSAGSAELLDMASVMKFSQVISSELQLKQLSTKVLQVIMECAGASAAVLVMKREDTFGVEAIALEGQSARAYSQPAQWDMADNLPVNVLRYVLKSNTLVNVGDVTNESRFANDPYLLEHKPSSILCLPVSYRDELVGALYLENRLNKNTFTPARLDVINLLLSQAAISFENANLFDQVTQLNENLEKEVTLRTQELNQAITDLEMANSELNAFSYSVSHDLRAPLRTMKGYGNIILDDYNHELTPDVKNLVGRIVKTSGKMKELIDGLLELSRIQRHEVQLATVNLSDLMMNLFQEMEERFPDQQVAANAVDGCNVLADDRILYSAMENLVSNAWKYSSKKPVSRVDFGVIDEDASGDRLQSVLNGIGDVPTEIPGGFRVFYIKDNGAGFDMSVANHLFGSFKRLHNDKQFEGTGIGLATVKQVIDKLGGKIWAQAKKAQGATFFFMLRLG